MKYIQKARNSTRFLRAASQTASVKQQSNTAVYLVNNELKKLSL